MSVRSESPTPTRAPQPQRFVLTLPNLALLQRHHATMDTEMKRPASGVVDDPDDPDKRPRADEENARMADAPDAPDAPDADDAIQAQVREAMESMITEVKKPAESYTLSELFLRSVHPPPWSPALVERAKEAEAMPCSYLDVRTYMKEFEKARVASNNLHHTLLGLVKSALARMQEQLDFKELQGKSLSELSRAGGGPEGQKKSRAHLRSQYRAVIFYEELRLLKATMQEYSRDAVYVARELGYFRARINSTRSKPKGFEDSFLQIADHLQRFEDAFLDRLVYESCLPRIQAHVYDQLKNAIYSDGDNDGRVTFFEGEETVDLVPAVFYRGGGEFGEKIAINPAENLIRLWKTARKLLGPENDLVSANAEDIKRLEEVVQRRKTENAENLKALKAKVETFLTDKEPAADAELPSYRVLREYKSTVKSIPAAKKKRLEALMNSEPVVVAALKEAPQTETYSSEELKALVQRADDLKLLEKAEAEIDSVRPWIEEMRRRESADQTRAELQAIIRNPMESTARALHFKIKTLKKASHRREGDVQLLAAAEAKMDTVKLYDDSALVKKEVKVDKLKTMSDSARERVFKALQRLVVDARKGKERRILFNAFLEDSVKVFGADLGRRIRRSRRERNFEVRHADASLAAAREVAQSRSSLHPQRGDLADSSSSRAAFSLRRSIASFRPLPPRKIHWIELAAFLLQLSSLRMRKLR